MKTSLMKTRDSPSRGRNKMSSPSLSGELNRFCGHANRLKLIFSETTKCFNDINVSGRFDGSQIVSAELLKEEELAITSVIEYPPTFVVFGQTPYAKSRVVNELFNKDVFPPLEPGDTHMKLRMVRFCHGDTNTVSLTVQDDYDLADNLEAYNGPWVTIPRSDLEVPAKGSADEASGLAVLEVTQNHPLLRFGVQIVVAPSHLPGEFEEVVNKCIEFATPIIIYGFTGDRFSDQDVLELHQLHQLTSMEPVFFVRVPPPGSRTVDTDPPDGAPISNPSPNLNARYLSHHSYHHYSNNNNNNNLLMPSSSHLSREGDGEDGNNTETGVSSDQLTCGGSNCPGSQNIMSYSSAMAKHTSPKTPPTKKHYSRKTDGGTDSSSSSPEPRVPTETINVGQYSPRHSIYMGCCVKEQLKRLGFFSAPDPNLPSSSSQSSASQSSSDNGNLPRSLSAAEAEASGIPPPSFQKARKEQLVTDSYLLENFTEFSGRLARFTRRTLQAYLVNASTVLNNSHTRCLNMFILSAFDMARDMLITPRKLEFAREKEEELYKSLLKISVSKLDEIKDLIGTTIDVIGGCIVAEAGEFEFRDIDVSETGQVSSTREVQICTDQIREMVLGRLNHAVAGKLVSSVDILRDSYTGTLTRCLESLETLDKENPEESKTTDALKQILNAAYTVEITVRSSSSFIKTLLEKMKQLVQSMPWKAPPVICKEWKEKVASDMLSNLSESRLARSISQQIKERLNRSHDQFSSALRQLELRHTGRLDKIEEHRLKLRKVHAPRLAKMALESTSLRDVTLFGMPHMGREIGRGQYGVVYSCDTWGSHSPCAIKSVVPPDDKHWNDLALEFFYTKNIPDHPRIVMLRGSVIDYMYGGGTSPAVLLIMDRLQRDLYTAIKQGLDWAGRLQVSIDVVAGLRYLHSQGLVHRDVKLKNVLLDRDNRGKITDLGFCKPEAMMSGSIVGTPIHMAPELFTGHYDNSVDVYAFGILFWYVCAGHVRLPNAFEQCANKDQLWQSVKRGLRPEQPVNCSEDCWTLMTGCWEGDPGRRPFFGDVEVTLKAILDKYRRRNGQGDKRPGSGGSNGGNGGGSSSSRNVYQSRQRRAQMHTRQIPSSTK